jgi:hypothetical protein
LLPACQHSKFAVQLSNCRKNSLKNIFIKTYEYLVHFTCVNRPMQKMTGNPKSDRCLCKTKYLKEERAEIAEKDLIAGAESTVGGTRKRLNAKISQEIEIQRWRVHQHE